MSKSKKWIVRAGLLGSALIFHNYQLNKIARKTDQLTAKAVDELNAAHPGLNADCYFIDVGGIILHTLIAGPEDGPLAVLLHGFPEHWVSWSKQVPALAQAGVLGRWRRWDKQGCCELRDAICDDQTTHLPGAL